MILDADGKPFPIPGQIDNFGRSLGAARALAADMAAAIYGDVEQRRIIDFRRAFGLPVSETYAGLARLMGSAS